ncbi:DNA primase [Methylophaga sp. OBS3]|nr:DNA primase [Methylophaga sp. OBS3]MCX4189712.1 DNA primase [Methylophaga sp. OBS3]
MAGQIPPQFIDELLARVDIVDVIDSRVPLKKAGKNLQACCPFHNEKSPSFTVSPEKQFYHCFGCGAHGTAVGFLMEYEQLSFPETIQELADSVGMQVPVTQQATLTPARQNLYDLLDKVAKYYSHQLYNHPQKSLFEDYLNQRGLSADIIRAFDIGIAPDGWDNLLRTFGNNQQTIDMLQEGGLLIKNDKGRIYDRFRKRLMFPIRDRRGRVIGFGGRIVDPEDNPKYLNSPETPVFHKGQELYGLYQARKANRQLQRILIVEGYMDVIALAQFGINNAVATLGTSTTPEHLRQLTRSAPEIVFCFDGDRAGFDAAWRAAENALPILGGNFELKFMFLPEGEDPDSVVRSQGAEAFNQQVNEAQGFSAFFLATLMQRVDMNSMDGRARLIEIAKPYLARIQAGVYRDMLEQQLAEAAQTSQATLKKHIERAPQPKKRVAAEKSASANKTPERRAITMLVQFPELSQHAGDISKLNNLESPGIPVLLSMLEILRESPQINTSARLLERCRESRFYPHLLKLAKEPLDFDDAEKLSADFQGVLKTLRADAENARYAMLTSKPFSQLSASERDELKAFKRF